MKERLFMEFANTAVDLLWSIDQWQPVRSDWSRAPLRRVRKNKEPLRSGRAIVLCRTKIRH
jgi:hypothetical protein